MKTLLIATALAAASFVPAVAHAGDAVTCAITDIRGNDLLYSFEDNTVNANGTLGGTVVETSFMKNGTMVASVPGMRPIWVYQSNMPGFMEIIQRSDPRWQINYSGDGSAMLMHDGNIAGQGSCTFRARGQTQATVGDMGQE